MSVKRLIASLGSACILVGGGAFAQGPTDDSMLAPSTEGAHLSPVAALAHAKDDVSKMQDVLRRIVQLQELAKKQKDIIKLNRINDKLIQVKGHIAVADQALSSMNEAVAKSDEAQTRHEGRRVDILLQKVLVLGAEAENAVGQELSYIGGTTTTVDIDPNVRPDDPTAFSPSFLFVLDTSRPPLASPTK